MPPRAKKATTNTADAAAASKPPPDAETLQQLAEAAKTAIQRAASKERELQDAYILRDQISQKIGEVDTDLRYQEWREAHAQRKAEELRRVREEMRREEMAVYTRIKADRALLESLTKDADNRKREVYRGHNVFGSSFNSDAEKRKDAAQSRKRADEAMGIETTRKRRRIAADDEPPPPAASRLPSPSVQRHGRGKAALHAFREQPVAAQNRDDILNPSDSDE
jgi:hypothetical protein